MTPDIANRVIASSTQEIRQLLDHALRAAQAADAWASAGVPEQAVRMLMDVKQPIFDATTLLNAASLVHRMPRE